MWINLSLGGAGKPRGSPGWSGSGLLISAPQTSSRRTGRCRTCVTLHTEAEVDVSQHVGDAVRIDDKVLRALVPELRSLGAGGSRHHGHPVKTRRTDYYYY